MQIQCPCCDVLFNIEEGFTSIEGKQLAALFAALEPTLGKAVLHYLRLFNPSKRALKISKAIKLVEELTSMVNTGVISADARTNEVKAATSKLWVMGIEQMLEQRDKLTLPLNGHNYLRKVVYSLASEPQIVATEKAANTQANNYGAVEYNERLGRIEADLRLNLISVDKAKQLISALNAEFSVYVSKLKQQKEIDKRDQAKQASTVSDHLTKIKQKLKNFKR